MTPTIPSEDTIATLRQLDLFPLDLVPPPIFHYHLEHIFVLDKILFTQALAIVPHLSSGEFSRIVYEHFLRCFILEDPSLGLSKLFQVAAVVVRGDIPRLVALVLGVNKLLAMVKDIGGLRPIAMGEMFLRLISCSIIL
jgi:hypothetical protein